MERQFVSEEEACGATPDVAGGAVDHEVWLLGQPLLREYLDFMREAAIGGAAADRGALVDEWRRANDHYANLEKRERGAADEAECRELDRSVGGLAEAVRAHPWFRRTFDTLPTRIGLVELDRLVVYQKSVTGTFVNALMERLGPSPTPEALFRFCMPIEPAATLAPVEVQPAGSRRFLFRSPSTDFRYHGATLLPPDAVQVPRAFGPIAYVVGLVVGYGSNLLNVIQGDGRLLLHNGYHRACAMRALGITHAPALIQTVTRPDELELAAKPEVAEDAEFYFHAARPPMLRDFFDPKLRKVVAVRGQERLVDLSFEARDLLVPA